LLDSGIMVAFYEFLSCFGWYVWVWISMMLTCFFLGVYGYEF
jgi:hypothetical protein